MILNRPNPARWKGWLDQMLPKPKKLGARGHHAATPHADLPAFMARLKGTPGAAPRALAFTVFTAARSGEVLNATWDEIDLKTATWTVPASRMKMGKPHAVPLSDAQSRSSAPLSAAKAPTFSPALGRGGPSASWR